MAIEIDYSEHPLYMEYLKGAVQVDESALQNLFQRSENLNISQTELGQEFDALVGDKLGVESSLYDCIREAFLSSVKKYHEEKRLRGSRLKPSFPLQAGAKEQALQLEENGYIQFQLSDEQLSRMRELLVDDIAKLKSEKLQTKGQILITNPGVAAHEYLFEQFESLGVFETLSALYGFRYGIIGFSLHLSHPKDKWFMEDFSFTPPKTAQFHYDLDYSVPKAMLYLSDVAEEQGPFSIVKNSHKKEGVNSVDLWFSKELALSLGKWMEEQNFPKQGGNEPYFRFPEIRKLYASLPKALRKTQVPGDHILDSSPLSEALLKREEKVCGPAGTCALFCGSNTLHRGGITTEGERWALQICIWPLAKEALPVDRKSSSLKEFIKRPARKLLGFLRKVKAQLKSSPEQPALDYSYVRFSNRMKNLLSPGNRIRAVDVGGASNLQPHWHRLQQSSDFIVFEPHLQSFEELEKRKTEDSYYKNFHYIQEALSGEGGERTLYMSNAPTGTSLYPPGLKSPANFPSNSYLYPMKEEIVSTTTLRESLSRQKVDTIDCIKLDTQGSELEILEGLDEARLSKLLLVEVEVPAVEHYDDPRASTISRMLNFVSAKVPNMNLFDLRCNRFSGNDISLGSDAVAKEYAMERQSPPLGHRLNEVDMVFLLDSKRAIDSGLDKTSLEKLLCLYSTYNFFPEALFAARYAVEKNIFSNEDLARVESALKELVEEASLQTQKYNNFYRANDWQNWGQYMEVPYPSN